MPMAVVEVTTAAKGERDRRAIAVVRVGLIVRGYITVAPERPAAVEMSAMTPAAPIAIMDVIYH
jgi:hypothetical protein